MRSHGQHAAGYQDRMKCASTALSLVQFPLLLFLDVPTAQLEALLRCGHPIGDQMQIARHSAGSWCAPFSLSAAVHVLLWPRNARAMVNPRTKRDKERARHFDRRANTR